MNITTTSPSAGPPVRWLALGAIAGPVLFNLGWLMLGPLQPGYSSVSQPVSALAIGPNGGLMRAVYLLYGVLVTVGVIAVFQGLKDELGAIARWTCTALLALSPLGILWAGIFTMDHLALHNIGVQLAISTPVITFPVVGLVLRRAPSWRRFGTVLMLLGAPLTLALLVGFINSVPVSEMATGGDSLGLWQRALGLEVFAWFVAMGWLAFRDSQRSATR
jgi:Protein of unknown function (DUF998)